MSITAVRVAAGRVVAHVNNRRSGVTERRVKDTCDVELALLFIELSVTVRRPTCTPHNSSAENPTRTSGYVARNSDH
jgi:hypothetical protein